MKKVSGKRRRYSVIVTRKRTARRLRWRSRTERLRRSVLRVMAPGVFDLAREQRRSELLRFLRKITDAVIWHGRRVRIDFRETFRMFPSGTLLFAAELHRVIALSKRRRLLSCSYPTDDVVAQVLKHVGIFDMLGQRRTCKITAENVKYWRVNSGSDVDGARAGEAILAYNELFTHPEKAMLYKGLTEAMTNSHQHAYQGPRGDGLPNVQRWWMFSQVYDDLLTVAICDLGIGIPRSLREDRAGTWGPLVAMMSRVRSDGDLITAAVTVGETRTGESYRGKGLREVRAVLDALGGTLQIFSNHGFYLYEADKKRSSCKNFPQSIQGTLVIWHVPVVKTGSS